jgi:hypothetical protein
MAPCRPDPQSIFFSRIIRNYNELRPETAAGSNCSWPPGRLAQLPNDFGRDPDIVQQTVVQRAQVLICMAARKPSPCSMNPAHCAGSVGPASLNNRGLRHCPVLHPIGRALAQPRTTPIESGKPCQQSINCLPCPRFSHESRRCPAIYRRLTGSRLSRLRRGAKASRERPKNSV